MWRYAAVLSLIAAGACEARSPPPARLVLYDGRIVTLSARLPQAQAIAVSGRRILAVGSDATIKRLITARTTTIDLHGMTVVPGFIDSHAHFLQTGQALSELDLGASSAPTWDDIVRKVAVAARHARPGEWIVGSGWHQEHWRQAPQPNFEGLPTGRQLDAVSPDNPVLLEHASEHAMFVNGLALKLAGIGADTPSPPGGEIVRDGSGRAIGMLRDAAMKPVLAALDASRAKESPAARKARLLREIALATHDALEHGVTTWQDMGEPFAVIDLYRALAAQGELGLRLDAWVAKEPPEALRSRLKSYFLVDYGKNHRLTVRGVGEILSDGALGTHSAWFFAPYRDVPSSSGYNVTPMKTIAAIATIALADGFQLSVHAIGDRANHEVLDLYQRMFATRPALTDLRWRIDHAQHLIAADIPRFGALKVIASMQTGHACDDAPYVVRRLGPERAAYAYAWHALITNHAVIANGTDSPVISLDPIPSLYCAVTRRERFSPAAPAFEPQQSMTRLEALRSYTYNGAYSMFKEKELGSLEPGKLADMVVLDRDIMTEPAADILATRVAYTILDGRIVYRRER